MQESDTLLLRTKLYKPALVKTLVPRLELLNHLNASRQLPFILVSAPAGYGKSTLLSSYLENMDWPSAWLTLDENDCNIIKFSRYFIFAIQTMFPDACRKTLNYLESDPLPMSETLSQILSDEIDTIDRDYFLVLDDYSYIHDVAVHDLLSRILRHPPHNMHLMISTRRDPPLPLVNLRAKQQMAEIRVQDLRFSPSETKILIHNLLATEVDDQTIATMTDKTEGWVTGLYLMALSFRQNHSLQININPSENDASVHEYLLSEVYSHIPIAIQDLLLKTSILDRFCAPLCDAVNYDNSTNIPLVSGIQFLDWIKKENIFLIPLDHENYWYQFHRLFRQFLQRQLKTRFNSEEIAVLHSRASFWFGQNQLFEEALNHALLAGDIKTGIQLVIQFNQKLKLPEQWNQLDHLVRSFPPKVIESSPDLLFAEACVMYARFQLGNMPRVLDRVEKLLSSPVIDSSRKIHLQSEIAALRSYLYFWAGDYRNALIYGRKALARLPEDWHDIRELTKIQMADAMRMLGEASPYASLMDHWVKLYTDLGTDSPTHLQKQIRICFIHTANTDLQNLKSVANNILMLSGENDLEVNTAVGHYFLGVSDYYQNNLIQAEYHFKQTFERRRFINILFTIQSALGLASIYQASSQINLAYEILNVTGAHLLEMNDIGLIAMIQAFQAELAVLQDDLVSANQWANEFDSGLLPPMQTLYYPHFTLLKILLARDTEDSRKEASDLLNRLLYCARSSHNRLFLIRVMVLETLFRKSRGEQSEALITLKKALHLARANSVIRPFIENGNSIADLLPYLSKDDVLVNQLRKTFIKETPSIIRANNKLVVPLTDRELKVMELLGQRLNNKEIAEKLVISTGTVKSHTIRIYQKLNVKNRRQAAEQALALGIVANIP